MAKKLKIVLATTSKDKIREIKKALSGLPLHFLTLSDFPRIKPARENGKTFQENAVIKARHAARQTGFTSLADDSGICVEALRGAPGIHSSRWVGKHAADTDRNNLLIEKLKNVPRKERKAYYECAIAIAVPPVKTKKIKLFIVDAKCRGVIQHKPEGKSGFGYDPLFYVPLYQCTMAQLPLKTKNKISHRGKALEKTKRILRRII